MTSPELATPPPGFGSRLLTIARLGKVVMIGNYIGLVIPASGVFADHAFSSRGLVVLVAYAVALVPLGCGVAVFDDIGGFRDGIDEYNYRRSQGSGLRSIEMKPLVAGRISERDAVRAAYASSAIGALGMMITAAIAGFVPWWFLPGIIGVALLATQYSYGIRLSFHGLQEISLLVMFSAVAFMGWAVTIQGSPAAIGIVQSAVFGLSMLEVSLFSNTFDRDGDRLAGRRTGAVVLSARGNAALVAGEHAAKWILVIAGVVAGVWSGWYVVALVPALANEIHQLRVGLRDGETLRARRLAMRSVALTLAALVVVNLARGI